LIVTLTIDEEREQLEFLVHIILRDWLDSHILPLVHAITDVDQKVLDPGVVSVPDINIFIMLVVNAFDIKFVNPWW